MSLSGDYHSLLPEVSQQTLLIPSDYFFCPYWVLNVALFGLFLLGFLIGIGSVYGWKQLFFRILTLLNQI